ncbi:MAG: universal stress protein [Deltaproteobacteria bacterium]|nr:universal stress protein [Deltaproteobacteria bacterium]
MKQNKGKKILVALDGSESALQTVEYLSKLPSLQDREIVLFTVFAKVPEAYWDLKSAPALKPRVMEIQSWQSQRSLDLDAYMKAAGDVLLNAGFSPERVNIVIHERQTGIARDIIQEARKGYEAVVAGKRGMGKIAGIVLGSVAMKLLQGITFAPLILVGKDPRSGKIMVGFDGSEDAMDAVRVVAAILGGSGWEVNLTHIIRYGEEQREAIAEAEQQIAGAMDQAMELLMAADVSRDLITTQIITGVTSRSETLVKEARQGGYGTIAVGRRGLSRVSAFFMGRVSNKVVQIARGHAVWVVS